MSDPQSTLNQIRRLLGSFPARGGDEALILHGYLSAISCFDLDLIEDGVDLVLRGELPGHDGRFAPTAPMLATACRLAAERAAHRRYVDRLRRPQLPAPEIEATPEQIARAKAKVQAFVQSQGSADAHQSAERVAAAKDRWERTNAMFHPPADDESVEQRLNLRRSRLGYSVGAPESDEAAA